MRNGLGSLPRDIAIYRGKAIRLLTMIAIVLSMPMVVFAQRDFSKVEINTIDLGFGLAMLQGAGGNIGVSTGADGVFLIDDQYAPLTERILAAIRLCRVRRFASYSTPIGMATIRAETKILGVRVL